MCRLRFSTLTAVLCCGFLGLGRAATPEKRLLANFDLDPEGRAIISTSPSEDIVEIRVSRDLRDWEVARTLLPESPARGGSETISPHRYTQAQGDPLFFTVLSADPGAVDPALVDKWQQWLSIRPTHYQLAIQRQGSWPQSVPYLSILNIVGAEVSDAHDGHTGESIEGEPRSLLPTVRAVFSQARSLTDTPFGFVDYDYLFGIPDTLQSSGSRHLPIGPYTAAIRGIPLKIVSSLPDAKDQGVLGVEAMRIIDGKLMIVEGAFPVCSSAKIELIALDSAFAADLPHQIDVYITNASGEEGCPAQQNGRALFELGPLSQSLIQSYDEINPVQIRLHTLVDGVATLVAEAPFHPQGVPLKIVESQPDDEREQSFSVVEARIKQVDTLAIDVLFPDCDNTGNTLVALPIFEESSPPQIDLYLRHNGNEQVNCQALTRDRLYFDLGPLWEPMRAALGKGASLTLDLNTVIDGEIAHVDSLTWSPGGQALQLLENQVSQPAGHIFWPWKVMALDYDRLRILASFPSSGTSASLVAVAAELQESSPPQLNVYLRHTRPEDQFYAAVITDASLTYDLTPLRDLLIEEFDAPEEILLHVHSVIRGKTELIDSVRYRPSQSEVE